MVTLPSDESQRKAARLVGLVYLLAIPPAVFGEASASVANLVANQRLFRLGTATNLATFMLDVVLITALFVVLRPVNRNLALFATFCGLIETTVLIVATVGDLEALRILSGPAYLQIFEPDRLQALAKLGLVAHGAAYHVGLVLAGLRSAVFAYIWLKSGFVPKTLAAWGIVSSLLLGGFAYAFIVFPELGRVITIVVYGGPIFLFELMMGLWLLIKGLRQPAPPLPRPVAAR